MPEHAHKCHGKWKRYCSLLCSKCRTESEVEARESRDVGEILAERDELLKRLKELIDFPDSNVALIAAKRAISKAESEGQ